MDEHDSLKGSTLMYPIAHLTALAVICLWPIGYVLGLGIAFHWMFVFHGCLLVAGTALALLYVLRCALRSHWSLIFVALCLFFLLWGLGLEFLLASAAKGPLSGDLFVAQYWNYQNRIQYTDLAWHVPSHYPSILRAGLVEALRLFPWYGIALYQVMFCVLAAGLTSHLVYQETRSPEASVISALLLLSLPLGMSGASIGFGLASTLMFLVLFFCHCINWASSRGGFLSISACGLALGYLCQSHYLGVFITPVALFILFASSVTGKRTLSGAIISTFWASVLLLFIVSPVLLSNFTFTGNPLYPLARAWLGGDFYNGKVLFDPIFRAIESSRVAGQLTIIGWQQALTLDGLLRVMIVVIGAASSFFWFLRYKWVTAVSIGLVLYTAIVFLVFYPAYDLLLPIVPLACILASIGIIHFSKLVSKQYWPLISMLAVIVQLVIFSISVRQHLLSKNQIEIVNNVIISKETPKATGALGELIDFVNGNESVSKLALVCMPNSFFLYYKPIIAIDRNDPKRFANLIREARSEHILFYDLKTKYSVSHIAVKADCMQNTIANMLPESGKKRFTDFVQRYLVNEFSNNAYDVFRLEDPVGNS